MISLTIEKCSHGVFAVSLTDSPDTNDRAQLTPQKCCGTWEKIWTWKLTSKQLREIAEEVEYAAQEAEYRTQRGSAFERKLKVPE